MPDDSPPSVPRSRENSRAPQLRSRRLRMQHGSLALVSRKEGLYCLSWNWRERSFVKITERTYEKRAQALYR